MLLARLGAALSLCLLSFSVLYSLLRRAPAAHCAHLTRTGLASLASGGALERVRDVLACATAYERENPQTLLSVFGLLYITLQAFASTASLVRLLVFVLFLLSHSSSPLGARLTPQ